MPAAINTNLNSLAAQRQLAANANNLGASIQRLSSGLRINGAKDDAAGLAISERFTAQIKGTDQAARNTNDGISLAQTAESALGQINDNLQRIRELAVQSANGTNSASDRAGLQAEATQLVNEIDRIASQTEFNGMKLLDGSFIGQQFQVGANRQQTIAVNAMGSMSSSVLGTYNGILNGTISGPMTLGAPAPMSVTLNGPGTVYNLGSVATDPKDVAAAISASGIPGLTVTLVKTQVQGAVQTSNLSSNGAATFTINGVNVSLNAVAGSDGASMQNRRDTAIAAVNAQSASTGVTARFDTASGFVMLESADGRNFTTSFAAGTATGSTASDFGLVAGASFMSPTPIKFVYAAPVGAAITSISFTLPGIVASNTFTVQSTGTSLKSMDISTSGGATSALGSIDAALANVNAARASMGALQNRFASTIANLQSSSENMSAARGRIVDADFAQETATLSRAQILQQASTAMVAQANQSPQGVLALLR